MIHDIRTGLVGNPVARALIRLLPGGPMTEIRGRTSRRIPVSLVGYIVDRIDAEGIHEGRFALRLDGGRLYDLGERRGHAGLSLRELVGLYDAGDVGLESAALTFDGDVVIETDDPALVARAQKRGSKTGFRRANAVLALAADAAMHSGRTLSGAY